MPNFAPRMDKEETYFDMDGYDKRAMDMIRQKIHEFYFQSASNSMFFFLCFEATKQFYIVFKYTCAPSLRKKLDSHFDTFESDLNKFRDKKMDKRTYETMRAKLMNLIDHVYKVKQVAGLGMKITRAKDAEALLKEVLS